MKRQYVNTLRDGDHVNDYFVAIRKDLRPRQNGGQFLGMVFKDRTGDIGGVVWNNPQSVAGLFDLGDVVTVRGRVQTYQNRLQIQVDQVQPLNESDYNMDDLVATPTDVKQELSRLRMILDTIESPQLKKLVELFFEEPDFLERFQSASAAKKVHHEYRGGLVRHCYEMARLAETMCELYPDMDRDLLLTGVFLHDLGKLYELRQEMFVDYTTIGRLLGHIHLGAEMADRKIQRIPEFPEHLRMQVLHMILSHHGEYVNGAPVLPQTMEAVVLHYIDNLSAQSACVNRVAREAREKRSEWSDFQQLINRCIWTKDQY